MSDLTLEKVDRWLSRADAVLQLLRTQVESGNGLGATADVAQTLRELEKEREAWPEVDIGAVFGQVELVGKFSAPDLRGSAALYRFSVPSDRPFLLRRIEVEAAEGAAIEVFKPDAFKWFAKGPASGTDCWLVVKPRERPSFRLAGSDGVGKIKILGYILGGE